MNIIYITPLILISSLAFGNQGGKALLQESCLSCHGEEMFNRKATKVTNHYDLRRQISFCRSNLNVAWFPEDEKSVVDYLNKTFYHFPENK